MKKTIHDALTYMVAILLLGMTYSSSSFAYEPDKTPENVQKKAVIVKHDARLFKRSTSNSGKHAPFMKIYFLMKPARGTRVPVSKSASKKGTPDGWLDKNSFVEWNTVQMIKLVPQSGRKLAKVFNTQECAELFGYNARHSGGCQPLGEEPNRSLSNNLDLLIPVFKKGRKSYKGGFIRVYQKDSTVKAAPTSPRVSRQPKIMGYDIVFAVDSTRSMQPYFFATMRVLSSFIQHIQRRVQGGEVKMPLRLGLLFYRDRILHSNCNLEFITRWGMKLTENSQKVIQTLGQAREATCSSEDWNEAVLDGLDRILTETQWRDNYFKVIVLVGDASPHSSDHPKNPRHFSVPSIIKRAEKRQIRFLAVKLGGEEGSFKHLAKKVSDQSNIGQYANVSTQDIQNFEARLLKAMIQEWKLLGKANIVRERGRQMLDDPTFRRQHDITGLDALIIHARLPSNRASQVPDFVKGWIPEEIKNRLVVREFIFMEKEELGILTEVLENIAVAAELGLSEGSEAFIDNVKQTLAAQAKMPLDELFQSSESWNSILQKVDVLPFKTDILSFSAEEVGSWKPRNYRRINAILKEKVKVLREFSQNPSNRHMIGGNAYLYVPRTSFP
jgi:hypothetical protein